MPARLIIFVFLVAPLAGAQTIPDESATRSLDRDLLLAIYDLDHPAMRGIMHGVDWSSTRLSIAAAPALATGIVLFDQHPHDLGPAYRLALSQAGTVAIVYALKYSVQRDRPYVTHGIASRSPAHPSSRPSYSFPSGHAAMASALATSLSLSYPEWWVIAPAATWAAAVTISRPWLGVHYPSDVLIGALTGAGVAALVHLVRNQITPAFISPAAAQPAAMVPVITIHW